MKKNSFNYPTVSLTDDNGKVWVMEEENYILATYLWDVTDENATPENTEFYVSSLYDNERPFFIEREELISINEEGHATFKLHLYKETKTYPISLEESFWGGSGMYGMYCVPLIHVDFSNSYIMLESILENMFPTKIESIIFGDNFDTSNVTSMRDMINNCGNLTSITFGNKFITSNVTNMGGMFEGCYSLTFLDLSSFDTSNVTNMNTMFYGCGNLTSLDLSNFDTSKVTNMGSMFYTCRSLTSLDLSNFDTSKVTNMGSMFYTCRSLTSLDLSLFDTSKVTDMYNMFQDCSKLETIKFGNKADVYKVSLMEYMFYNVPSSCVLTLCSNTQESWDNLLSKSSVKFNSIVNYKTCEEPNE